MKLWTIQRKEVKDILDSGSNYHCDPTLSEFLTDDGCKEVFQPCYDYVSKKLSQQSKNPRHITSPIWAWYFKDNNQLKKHMPRLLKSYNNQWIVMELEVNDQEVLLTDFDKYNKALIGGILAWMTEEQEKEIEDNCPHDNFFCGECNCWDIAEEEWMNVDEKTRDTYWDEMLDTSKSSLIQACFWEIKPEHVVSTSIIPIDIDEKD